MDALLTHKGIYRFTETDTSEAHSYSYCFTDEMIQQRMIVVLGQHVELLLEEDEELELLEVDGVVDDETKSGEWDEDDDDDDDDDLMPPPDAEYETSIAVLFLADKVTYHFQLFHSSDPVLAPLVVYRVILDAIETITLSDKSTLIANLTGISTGVSTAEELKNKEWRNNSYNYTVDKVNAALRLYSEHKAGKK